MNFIHDASPEAPQRSDSTQGDGETVGISSDQDSGHEAPQRNDPTQGNGETVGIRSDQDSGHEAPQRNDPTQGEGETVGIRSDQDSGHEAPQRNDPTQGEGETVGISSHQDYGHEAPQRNDPTQGNGETVGIRSDQDSGHEAPQRNDPTQGEGETVGISSHQDYGHEAPQRNDPTQGNGETVGIRSDQDSGHEAAQRNDPTQGEGETVGISSHQDYGHEAPQRSDPASDSPTDTEQCMGVTNKNTEILEEREGSQANIQHISQESSSEMTALNESEGNDSTPTPTAFGCKVDSNSLPGITNAHLAEHNLVGASGCIQEIDTSSNTQTNNQISDFTTNEPSNVTDPADPSKATAEVSPRLAKSNTVLCPFSEQPLQHDNHDNSPREMDGKSTNNKDSDSEPHAKTAPISQEEPHQAALDADPARSGSSAAEDTPLMSSRLPGPSHAPGIRNLFPQVSVDSPSVGRHRSNSQKTAGDVGSTDDSEAVGETVEGDVVLVTGGCGFLGQHIVKLLNLRAPHVGEIRVLDLIYFEKKLDYPTTKRVKSLVGDISNAEFVRKALKGVNSVIHVAGVVSWGTFPDYEGMERVNVKGTVNVLNACLENNVQRLIYCSTVDVAVGSKPIRGGTEQDTPIPDKFLFPGYPETKFHGERVILGSANLPRRDGEHLQTAILRPNVLYGELDKYYVTNALRMAKQSMGVLYQIGNGKAMFQQAYVGNTAWAFVCADTAMKANPGLTREVFYVPDNTPVQNSFTFMKPFLQAHGLKLSSGYLSYALSHSAVAAAELFAKALSPVMKLNLPIQSCTIAYINTDLYFRGEKAQRMLNYYPIYTPSDAMEMSMKFYANLELEVRPRGGNNPEQR